MLLRVSIASHIPQPILNKILLVFPFLYRVKFISYESYIIENNGVDDLLTYLDKVLSLDGDIIECGSGRCGSSIIMANYLKKRGINKKVYACDTFAGFDPEELQAERENSLTQAADNSLRHTSYEYVKKKIQRLGLSDYVIPVRGLFRDTLSLITCKFSFGFVDCDLKESIIYATETIWPKLSKNGIILFDDYTTDGFKGAKEAINFLVNKYGDEISGRGLLHRLYFIQKK